MQSAEKLSITLPPEMASFIHQKVASGPYGSSLQNRNPFFRQWA